MKIEEGKMVLMPAAPGTCPICATKHDPEQPHNQQSLYYQMRFQMECGRGATWADAMNHCSDEIKTFWTAALKEHGIEVNHKENAPAGQPSEQGAE